MNFGPQTARNRSGLLPTLTILFRPSPSRPLFGVNVAPHSDSKNETTLGLSAAQIRSPEYVKNATASGDLKWQCITIIATFLVIFYFY